MKFWYGLIITALISSSHLFGQDSLDFTTGARKLDEVIITGQFHPQAASNSVYQVKTITHSEIRAQGALQLTEVLQTRLNITVSQDLAIGSTGLSMQGISGQNIKVLVDGVPLIGRNGNGNNADLSQINLANVDRIEIVEGPMAVSYGANALAGVINLLTNQEQPEKISLNAQIQSETAGDEVGLAQGRHFQDINVGYRINSHWSARFNLGRNDFNGFKGHAPDRTYEWNPKRQYFGSALLRYQHKIFDVHYKLDYLNELIEAPGLSQNNFQPSTGINRPFAFDERYQTDRFIHQLQANLSRKNGDRFNMIASYSDFARDKSRYSKDLTSGEETLTTGTGDQDISTYITWVFRGTYFSNLTKWMSAQFGYDLNLEQAGGGRILEGEQAVEDYALFASAEIIAGDRLKLRPGLMVTHNTIFKTPWMPSLRAKYDFGNRLQLRASYSRGFRSPGIRELFFEFVDSNHRIFGNPALEPEYGHHFNMTLSKTYQWKGGAYLKQDLASFYNDIDNRITFGQSATDPTVVTYINILEFKTIGWNLMHELYTNSFSASLGFSYFGRFNQLSETQTGLDEFLFTPEVTGRLNYTLKPIKVTPSIFYKYTGRVESFFIENDPETGEEQVVSGSNASFSWLDLTISRPLTKGLSATLGVKNLLDVRNITSVGAGGGAHSGGSTIPISYGRSYFLRLQYHL